MKMKHGVWFVCADRQSEFYHDGTTGQTVGIHSSPEEPVRQRPDDTRRPDPYPSPSAWTCAMPSPTRKWMTRRL